MNILTSAINKCRSGFVHCSLTHIIARTAFTKLLTMLICVNDNARMRVTCFHSAPIGFGTEV